MSKQPPEDTDNNNMLILHGKPSVGRCTATMRTPCGCAVTVLQESHAHLHLATWIAQFPVQQMWLIQYSEYVSHVRDS